MSNVYIEIYTQDESEKCLQWVDSIVRLILKRNIKLSVIYEEHDKTGKYSYVHFSFLLQSDNSYERMHDLLKNEHIDLIINRPEDCHILVTPQKTIDYKVGLGERHISTQLRTFPNVTGASRFVGYSKNEAIVVHKKTGFCVIANGHRSKFGNVDLAGQYLYSRVEFYKKLPKDAIWY